jgi:hypothetical protein
MHLKLSVKIEGKFVIYVICASGCVGEFYRGQTPTQWHLYENFLNQGLTPNEAGNIKLKSTTKI